MARVSLTQEQTFELQMLAKSSMQAGTAPVARLMRFSEDWGIDYAEIAREYTSLSLAVREQVAQRQRPQHQPFNQGPTPVRPITPQPRTEESAPSPVAGIRAEAGAIYVQGYNWPLIEARIRSGLTPGDIARLLNPPMTQADYKRVEEGRLLPSADHVAQLCQLLEVSMEDAFVMAGPDAPQPGKGRAGFIKGTSVLGVLRVRRRLTYKAMAEEILAETTVTVPSAFLSAIENGKFDLRSEPSAVERVYLNAIAAYLDLPVEWVLKKVPPELLMKATANTRQMHAAVNTAAKALPLVDITKPQLLTAGNEGDK